MESPITITAFYTFTPIEESDLETKQEEIHAFGKQNNMRGLVLLATEGINGTVCGTPEVIAQWKELLEQHFGEMIFKDSKADELVFKRWFVKIRNEIVSLRQSDVHPNGEHKHLSPEEWDRVMEEEDVVVLDTRNAYETEVGVFEGAVDPELSNFQEFPEYLRTSPIPKDKKVLMYCTGGIRCEKALIEMEKHGYDNVYQLEGGILAYMAKFPNGKFKGECFVFDKRVSVDQDLKPSQRYATCPHCGNPGDQKIDCRLCGAEGTVCVHCTANDKAKETCCKDCAYRYKRAQVKIEAS